MSNLQNIDGSVLEGGGQILRMSVAFSAILGIPIRVSKIRAGRSKPGLAAQHLTGLQLVAEMCQAKTKGLALGSTEIEFIPGKIKGGHYSADCMTAGSVGLLLQQALPLALLADGPSRLSLRGGTNAAMAPQVDYLTEVFRPLLERLGGTFDFDLHRRGYFPRGGGHVTVGVSPVAGFRAASMTQPGRARRVAGWSFVAGSLPLRLAQQMAEGARQALAPVCADVDIECYKEDPQVAPDDCSGMVIVCESSTGCVLGADMLGRRGGDAARGGRGAGGALAAALARGLCLDTHAQDQVILYAALAAGRSAFRVGDVTSHARTAMFVATSLAQVQFTVTPSDASNVIECSGLGFTNTNLPPR